MWGSGRDKISGIMENRYHSYRNLLSRPPEEGNMDRLVNYSWHTEWKKWCDDDDGGGSGVCGAFILCGFTRTLILCSFMDSGMPGDKVCHAGQGCGQALALASRAWVSGQERWNVITMPKDALILDGHSVYGEIFPCRLLLWTVLPQQDQTGVSHLCFWSGVSDEWEIKY